MFALPKTCQNVVFTLFSTLISWRKICFFYFIWLYKIVCVKAFFSFERWQLNGEILSELAAYVFALHNHWGLQFRHHYMKSVVVISFHCTLYNIKVTSSLMLLWISRSIICRLNHVLCTCNKRINCVSWLKNIVAWDCCIKYYKALFIKQTSLIVQIESLFSLFLNFLYCSYTIVLYFR